MGKMGEKYIVFPRSFSRYGEFSKKSKEMKEIVIKNIK
jgi:hypothetical protein